MKLSWDPEKRQRNFAKHGLDFGDAGEVLKGAMFGFEDRRFDYTEQRFSGLGLLRGSVVVIVYTEPEEDHFRILSMRKATGNEQKIYFRKLTN